MPRALEPRLRDLLAKYHDEPSRAVWDCRGTWVIYHKDVEIIAARAGVQFDPPTVLEANGTAKCVALCVTAHFGERSDWSVGEAAPGNNKNAYPFAMAEKRARDRVVLKLLGLSGLYSDEEADEFKGGTPAQAHIPIAPVFSSGKSEADDERECDFLIDSMTRSVSAQALKVWGEQNKTAIEKLSTPSQDRLRGVYRERNASFANITTERAA